MATSTAKLSQREINLIGLMLIALALIPFFIFTVPAWRDFTQKRQTVESNNDRIKNIKQQIRLLPKITKENLELKKKMTVRKAFLANSHEIDFLVQDLKTICDESSVSLESFVPGDIEPVNIVLLKQLEQEQIAKNLNKSNIKKSREKLKDQSLQVDLYRLPIEVRIVGNFTDILELFKNLEKYGRVISVDNISIGKVQSRKSSSKNRFSSGSTASLYTTFDLVAYSLANENQVLPVSVFNSATRNTFTYKKKRR